MRSQMRCSEKQRLCARRKRRVWILARPGRRISLSSNRMRPFKLPASIENSEKTNVTNCVFLAWSDLNGLCPLHFERYEVNEVYRNWSQVQYNLETSRGSAMPRDMIFGFQVIEFCPRWTRGDARAGFERMTRKLFGEPFMIPALEKLKRLDDSTFLSDGMFIILVRCPRPIGCRNIVPFDFRKDVLQMRADYETTKNEDLLTMIKALLLKSKNDVHPTNAQLFLTKNKALVQQVASHISCTVCGAVGHHMAHTHKDIVSADLNENVIVEYPDWMNVKPMPDEVLSIPSQEEGGVEVQIRQVTTSVPLRLARAIKLRGGNVIGEVNKCGVNL